MACDSKEWRAGYADHDLIKECAIFAETVGPLVQKGKEAAANMLAMKKARDAEMKKTAKKRN